jgi:hypothetical protein
LAELLQWSATVRGVWMKRDADILDHVNVPIKC